MDKQRLTAAEIEDLLFTNRFNTAQMKSFQEDERAVVKRLLKRWGKERQEQKRVEKLYVYEYEMRDKGYALIAGIDEAGRGPLAGPVVVAAVILPLGLYLPKINDSKKLSAKRREEIYEQILKEAIAVERAVIDRETIDCINIYQATILGMREVVEKLQPVPQALLIDAVPLDVAIPTLSLIKGDSLSASIAAASIIAKVERDRLMQQLDITYPGYGFANHKGYGTPEHLQAIQKYGPCPAHRRTFEPICSWRG